MSKFRSYWLSHDSKIPLHESPIISIVGVWSTYLKHAGPIFNHFPLSFRVKSSRNHVSTTTQVYGWKFKNRGEPHQNGWFFDWKKTHYIKWMKIWGKTPPFKETPIWSLDSHPWLPWSWEFSKPGSGNNYKWPSNTFRAKLTLIRTYSNLNGLSVFHNYL